MLIRRLARSAGSAKLRLPGFARLTYLAVALAPIARKVERLICSSSAGDFSRSSSSTVLLRLVTVSAAPIFVKGLQLSPALVGCFPAVAVSGTILGASLARWAATRVQPARIVRVGSLIALASSIAMAWIPISAPYLLGAITFFCLGFGFALPVTVSMAMANFGDKAGAASALLGAIQSIGGTIGASMVALIATYRREMRLANVVSSVG